MKYLKTYNVLAYKNIHVLICVQVNEMNEVTWLIAIKIAFSYVSWTGFWNGLEFIFKVLDMALMFKHV